MKISAFMNAPAVTVSPSASARRAALRMRDAAVGSALVTEVDQVLGVVTDRDLTVRCLAGGRDPDMPVSDLMSAPVVTVDATDDIDVAYRTFRRSGVRRRRLDRPARTRTLAPLRAVLGTQPLSGTDLAIACGLSALGYLVMRLQAGLFPACVGEAVRTRTR
ncbi:CBS domain-containing protein [Streptomyces sp. NPDC088732]|uniref:CBS domain-containing protein n=1 Tax=Streptomyces sp. NPDC088732 TaxID=3365879 RepID=UPI0038201E11